MAKAFRISVRPLGRAAPLVHFRRVLQGRMPFFLDSSLSDPGLARYSFLGSNPVGWFRSRGSCAAFSTPWDEDSHRGDPLEAFRRFSESLPWARVGRPRGGSVSDQ